MNGRNSPAAPDCIKVRSPRYTVDRIVVHAQDGTQAGTEAWFKKPGRTPPTAAHYLIGRDGAVVQMVPDDRKAIHAGSPTDADNCPGYTLRLTDSAARITAPT